MQLKTLMICEMPKQDFRSLELFVEFILDQSDLTLLVQHEGESGSASQSRSGHIEETVRDLLSRKQGGFSESARAMIDKNWCLHEQFIPKGADPALVASWLHYIADRIARMPDDFHEMVKRERLEKQEIKAQLEAGEAV